MRYLTISVWPLRDANIKELHPSWKKKKNMKLFNAISYVSSTEYSWYHTIIKYHQTLDAKYSVSCKKSATFGSMRHLAIPVWPLSGAPLWEKWRWHYLMPLVMAQQQILTRYYHYQLMLKHTCVCKSGDVFASMRYLKVFE